MSNFLCLDRSYLFDQEEKIRQGAYYKKVVFEIPGRKKFRSGGIRSGIYFILGLFVLANEVVPLVKIGYTLDIRRRWKCSCSRTGIGDNPTDLFIVHFAPLFGTIRDLRAAEHFYHLKFSQYCERGEWYQFYPVAKYMGWNYEEFFEKE